MAITNFVLTNAGKALLAKAQAGTTLEFTGAEMGSGVLTASEIAPATKLASKKADMQLSSVEVIEKEAYVELRYSNKDLKQGFNWSEVGLFANDPEVGRILYAYGSTAEPDSIPAGSSGGDYEFIFNMITTVDNAANVSATVSGSLVYATLDDLEEYTEEAPNDGKSYVRKNETWSEATSKKTCKFVIGSSTAGYTVADVDYLCDGTADQVEINAAINALPDGGGEILLLDGTYTLTGGIIIDNDKVSLRGNGNNTVISRTFTSDTNAKNSMLYINANYCKIQELYILDDFDASDNSYTIYTLGNNITFCNNTIDLKGGFNGTATCFYLGKGNNNNISDNYFSCGHGYFRDVLEVVDNYKSIISGNNIQSSSGGDSLGVVVTGKGSNTITGNYINGYGDIVAGIYITTDDNTITGNNIDVVSRGSFDGYGLYISGNRNTVSGNKCNDTTSDYTYNGSFVSNIYVSGKNNTITGNSAGYSSTVEDFWDTIHLTSTSANNLIANNNVFGKPVTDLGSGNTVRGNKTAAVMPPEGRRSSRYVIGSSTAGYTANDVDFLCTGTDDQIVINAAIAALPDGGGKIELLDGTYVLSDKIVINKDNVTLQGNGNNTILQRNFGNVNLEQASMLIISSDNCKVKDLYFFDNYVYDSDLPPAGYSIYVTGNAVTINNNKLYYPNENTRNQTGQGIYLAGQGKNLVKNNEIDCHHYETTYAIRVVDNSDTRLENNRIMIDSHGGGNTYAIYITGGKSNTIVGNDLNAKSDDCSGTALHLSSDNCTVTGNIFQVLGYYNNAYGLFLAGNYNTVTGNTSNDPDMNNIGPGHGYGIYVTGSKNTICGNTAAYSTTPTNYQHTICLTSNSSDNLVTNNNIFGKNAENTGTNNTLANNKYN